MLATHSARDVLRKGN